MRGASRESLAAGRERLEALLATRGADPVAVADVLFSVTNLLAATPGLRRALTDPSRSPAAKGELLTRILQGKVSAGTVELLAGLARGRWAAAADLTDAVESLAVSAVLASAERAGRLDAVEDELFRFSRIVAGDTTLRDAFSQRTEGTDRKSQLAARLLSGKAAPETIRLASQAAAYPRGLRTEHVLQTYVEAAAQRRRLIVAQVVSAVALTSSQRDRLEAALQRTYGQGVRIALEVDPGVVGGLRIQVGGEVIDGTLATRLDKARRRLAG